MDIYMQNLYNSFVNFCSSIFGKTEKIHETSINEETRLKEQTEYLEDGTLDNIQHQNEKNKLEENEK